MDFKKNFSHKYYYLNEKSLFFASFSYISAIFDYYIYKKTSNHYHQQQTNQKIHEFS